MSDNKLISRFRCKFSAHFRSLSYVYTLKVTDEKHFNIPCFRYSCHLQIHSFEIDLFSLADTNSAFLRALGCLLGYFKTTAGNHGCGRCGENSVSIKPAVKCPCEQNHYRLKHREHDYNADCHGMSIIFNQLSLIVFDHLQSSSIIFNNLYSSSIITSQALSIINSYDFDQCDHDECNNDNVTIFIFTTCLLSK